MLRDCLPQRVSHYLFEDGVVRDEPFDLSPIEELLRENRDDLIGYLENAFRQGWPDADAEVTAVEALAAHVGGMAAGLSEVIGRLRFVAWRFHRDVDEQRIEMPAFEVSTERQAVKETSATAERAGLGSAILRTISVCDVDLVHQSHISDEEELRFQMGVAVYGLERGQHGGGAAWRWGEQALQHRKAVRLRLVNVGATGAIDRFARFGYPVCTVCGQSVSPLSSDRQREHFETTHAERCGRKIEPVGFYADVVADTISLPACENHTPSDTLAMSACHSSTRHELQLSWGSRRESGRRILDRNRPGFLGSNEDYAGGLGTSARTLARRQLPYFLELDSSCVVWVRVLAPASQAGRGRFEGLARPCCNPVVRPLPRVSSKISAYGTATGLRAAGASSGGTLAGKTPRWPV